MTMRRMSMLAASDLKAADADAPDQPDQGARATQAEGNHDDRSHDHSLNDPGAPLARLQDHPALVALRADHDAQPDGARDEATAADAARTLQPVSSREGLPA